MYYQSKKDAAKTKVTLCFNIVESAGMEKSLLSTPASGAEKKRTSTA
jgi:hypothetical protein